jgi:hypothetical protein
VCAVSECDRETWMLRRPWPIGAFAPWGPGGNTRLSINNCLYFVMLLLHVSASIGHLDGGYLQRKYFVINLHEDCLKGPKHVGGASQSNE